MNIHDPASKQITEAKAFIVTLFAERQSRGGKYPDDERIATEIAAVLFKVGRLKKGYADSVENYEKTIREWKGIIEDLSDLQKKLTTELDKVTNKTLS